MTSIQDEAHPISGGNHSEGLPRSHKRRCPDLYAQLPSEGPTKLVRKAKKVWKWSFLYLDDYLNAGFICRNRLALIHVTPSRKVGDSFILLSLCIFEACSLQTFSIPNSAFFMNPTIRTFWYYLAVFGFYEPPRTIFRGWLGSKIPFFCFNFFSLSFWQI